MRKDLNMRKGKMIAQGGHGVTMIAVNALASNGIELSKFTEWIWKHGQKKITVSVNSLEELNDAYQKARNNDILCYMVIDSGKTEFHGVFTPTCCVIGPDEDEKIDKITKELKLL